MRFEKTNHDIAKSFGEKKYWLDRLASCFRMGMFWQTCLTGGMSLAQRMRHARRSHSIRRWHSEQYVTTIGASLCGRMEL